MKSVARPQHRPGPAPIRRRWLFPPPQGRPAERDRDRRPARLTTSQKLAVAVSPSPLTPTQAASTAAAAVLAIALLCAQPALVAAQALSPSTEYEYQSDIGVCKSIDIRNSLSTFQRLKGCRVIEGFLQILLFDNMNETALADISFPELTEITDYLLLYRVHGLRSIGQLFPNLAVIRGQNLFYSNAFIIFEMSSLQEIGLYHLTNISRGNVRIDKNPSLCFLNSIDWSKIIQDGSEPYIKSLKPENECPICTGGEETNSEGVALASRSILCKNATKTSGESVRRLCWNRQHCQKICPPHCSTCNDKLECCSALCIGGCSNYDITNCTVCKDYSMGFGNNETHKRQCLKTCPPNHYKYLDRRCVTKEECLAMQKPIDPQSSPPDGGVVQTHKIFNGSCIFRCPANYMDDTENFTCKPCGGRCKKLCPPVNIDSISMASQLRGCTHITGSLEIQIRGGSNVVSELEENLSMIEEIYGYLKVVRSFSLVSLNFFKTLRRIKGESLDSSKYVFIVMDNQNLQELWDWQNNRTLQVDRGSLFFHFNPKLCYKKIKVLQEKAHMANFTDLEVAPNSNGDKIACEVEELNVTVTKIHHKAAVLEWKTFQLGDHRKLLGYIVYSIEAPYRNVTVYDGRDACGQDNWRVDDVAPASGDKLNHLLTNLEPYTQYAIYVKTYTIASEKRGAQSKILYIRTKPAMPSPPQRVIVTSNSSDSLKVTWSPPARPHGNLTHYIVSGRIHNGGFLDSKDRNYCKEPPTIPKPQIQQVPATPAAKNDTCSCTDNKPGTSRIDESEEFARIRFEDELQNQVYIKRPEKNRKKREKPGDVQDTMSNNGIRNITENGTSIWESFNFPVFGSTEFFINNLRHFTMYDINVQACREKEDSDSESSCSSISIKTAKTLMKPGADRIYKVQITNQSLDTVTIQWDQPQDPNGVIYTINVEYKRADIENAGAYTDCITVKDFKNDSMTYTINKLYPGNYSLRVWAISSASLLSTNPQAYEYSDYIYFSVREPSSNILAIVVSLTLIMGLVISGVVYIFYKRQKEKDSMRLIPSVNPEYVPSVYVPDEWEVPRKNIDLIKELGQGSFGMVWEGVAHDIKGKAHIRCAVKTVNEHATNRERLEFLNEASVMKAFDTAHVVRLLGVVSQGQPTLVIMELMAHGDLKSYLRSHRPDAESFDPQKPKHPPTLKQILQMAIEIADGMAYLAAKKFVHRDLAARNCMVSEDLTVKIGDFGMTRDIYETDYYRKGTKGLLPVRWMAPESLKDGIFTSCSDVWSYGVVLWEMATLASQPYQGLSNDMVLRYVIDGGVMERPDNCPDKLYALMRCCWQHKPSSRPSFLKLCTLLLDDANQEFTHVSFYHSPAGVEARSTRPTPSPSQDDPTTPLRNAVNRLSGYTPSDSQESDDLDIDTHHHFPSISESTGVTTTANGYISGAPTNGAASTQ